jgi:hypothetical protein
MAGGLRPGPVEFVPIPVETLAAVGLAVPSLAHDEVTAADGGDEAPPGR